MTSRFGVTSNSDTRAPNGPKIRLNTTRSKVQCTCVNNIHESPNFSPFALPPAIFESQAILRQMRGITQITESPNFHSFCSMAKHFQITGDFETSALSEWHKNGELYKVKGSSYMYCCCPLVPSLSLFHSTAPAFVLKTFENSALNGPKIILKRTGSNVPHIRVRVEILGVFETSAPNDSK